MYVRSPEIDESPSNQSKPIVTDSSRTESTSQLVEPSIRLSPAIRGNRFEISNVEVAKVQKEEANEMVKKGRWREAIVQYDEVLKLLEISRKNGENYSLISQIYSNRALCNLRLSSPSAALADCDAALKHEQGNLKARYRRGQALFKLTRFQESLDDFLLCGEEGMVEAEKSKRAIEDEKEKKRAMARMIVTKANLENFENAKILEIKEDKPENSSIPENVKKIENPKSAYVPKSARMLSVPESQTFTYGDFLKLWRSQKTDRLSILQNLELSRLPALFKESLDFDIFWDLISTLIACTNQKFIPEFLFALTKVRRFDLIVGLMGKYEKSQINLYLDNFGESQQFLQIKTLYNL